MRIDVGRALTDDVVASDALSCMHESLEHVFDVHASVVHACTYARTTCVRLVNPQQTLHECDTTTQHCAPPGGLLCFGLVKHSFSFMATPYVKRDTRDVNALCDRPNSTAPYSTATAGRAGVMSLQPRNVRIVACMRCFSRSLAPKPPTRSTYLKLYRRHSSVVARQHGGSVVSGGSVFPFSKVEPPDAQTFFAAYR